MLGFVIGVAALGLGYLERMRSKRKRDVRPKQLPFQKPVKIGSISQEIEHAIEDNSQEKPQDRELLSPFPEATNEQWTELVRILAPAKMDAISSKYRLGMFLLDMRQLQEYGYATGVKQVEWKDDKVYQGTWIEPYSLDRFLHTPELQYEAFIKVMHGHYELIKAKPSTHPEISLSGKLALARMAGMGGMESWLNKVEDREKFTKTTRVVRAANGIF